MTSMRDYEGMITKIMATTSTNDDKCCYLVLFLFQLRHLYSAIPVVRGEGTQVENSSGQSDK